MFNFNGTIVSRINDAGQELVHTLKNSSRNPHNYEILNKFNDDDKWLLMGESRPETMNWIILTPLNN